MAEKLDTTVERNFLEESNANALNDEALLARMGYKQEFKRDFSRCGFT